MHRLSVVCTAADSLGIMVDERASEIDTSLVEFKLR
jgi:hypothetical protein